MDGATTAAWSAAGIATIATGIATWQALYSRSAARSSKRQADAADEQLALMRQQHGDQVARMREQYEAENEQRAEQSAAVIREAALVYLGRTEAFFELAHRMGTYKHDFSYEQSLAAMHEGRAMARVANVFAYFPAADLPLGDLATQTRRMMDRMFSDRHGFSFGQLKDVTADGMKLTRDLRKDVERLLPPRLVVGAVSKSDGDAPEAVEAA